MSIKEQIQLLIKSIEYYKLTLVIIRDGVTSEALKLDEIELSKLMNSFPEYVL